ncbi:hypothetical protein GCM10009601_35610 [Streptomyces thermospinosisporus]|uniref:Uncharacterized protein n=1 Tax=Streptomyces thermospinosisporus TaxID=161482 RepID=A0ABP4JRN4_9ACTN
MVDAGAWSQGGQIGVTVCVGKMGEARGVAGDVDASAPNGVVGSAPCAQCGQGGGSDVLTVRRLQVSGCPYGRPWGRKRFRLDGDGSVGDVPPCGDAYMPDQPVGSSDERYMPIARSTPEITARRRGGGVWSATLLPR